MECLSLVINLNTSPLSNIHVQIFFSLSVTCLFAFLVTSFKEQPFFNTDKVQLYFVHFLFVQLVFYESFAYPKITKFYPIFFSRSFNLYTKIYEPPQVKQNMI